MNMGIFWFKNAFLTHYNSPVCYCSVRLDLTINITQPTADPYDIPFSSPLGLRFLLLSSHWTVSLPWVVNLSCYGRCVSESSSSEVVPLLPHKVPATSDMWIFPFRCGVRLRLIICPHKVTHCFFIRVPKVSPLSLEFRKPLGVRVGMDFSVNLAWTGSGTSLAFISVLLNELCFVQVATPAGL